MLQVNPFGGFEVAPFACQFHLLRCFFNSQLYGVLYLQLSQARDFSLFIFSWNLFMCSATKYFWVNILSHSRQAYFLTFSWTVNLATEPKNISVQQSNCKCNFTLPLSSCLCNKLTTPHLCIKIICFFQGCDFTTKRKDNYEAYHLPPHTGRFPFYCEVDGCTYGNTRRDRVEKHRSKCPQLESKFNRLKWNVWVSVVLHILCIKQTDNEMKKINVFNKGSKFYPRKTFNINPADQINIRQKYQQWTQGDCRLWLSAPLISFQNSPLTNFHVQGQDVS